MLAVKIQCTLGWNLLFLSTVYNCKCAYLSFKNSTHPQLASVQWTLFRLWQLENEEMEAFVNTIAPWPMPIRPSLRSLQKCGAFIPTFTSEKWKMSIKKSLFRNCKLIQNFFHCAFANPCTMENQRRSRRCVHLTAQLAIRQLRCRCLIAHYWMRWHCKFKG